MPRKEIEKKLDFELTGVRHIRQKTRDPKPTARTNRPYVQPKASFQGGRFVLRTKKIIQLETQREIADTIMRIAIVQGERNVQVYLHFDDGTIQQL